MYTMECYLAIKKNEILLFVTTWMDLEGIMLNEISQTEKGKYHIFHLHVKFEKTKELNKHNKTETENKLMVARGEQDGRGGK